MLPEHSVTKVMENLDEEQKDLIISARKRIDRLSRQPSDIVDLVFGTLFFSRYIFAWSVRILITPSIPIIKRCFICQRFGHVNEQCRSSSPNCEHCRGKHRTNGCNDPRATSECFNCAGDHTASSRNCLVYKYEFEVIKEKYLNNISEADARNKLAERGWVNPRRRKSSDLSQESDSDSVNKSEFNDQNKDKRLSDSDRQDLSLSEVEITDQSLEEIGSASKASLGLLYQGGQSIDNNPPDKGANGGHVKTGHQPGSQVEA